MLAIRSFDCKPQRQRIAIVNHVVETEAGIAVGVREILMSRAVEMHDFATFTDQNDARVKMLQQHLLVQIREFNGVVLLKPARSDSCPYGQTTCGKSRKLLAPVNPAGSGDRLK